MRLIIHNANQFKLKQDLLWVGVSTLATVIIWIIYSVYVAFTQSTVDPQINKYLTPINPTLDKAVLAQLEDRYLPPDSFTILVRQEFGESSRIVPLGTPVTLPDQPDLSLPVSAEGVSTPSAVVR